MKKIYFYFYSSKKRIIFKNKNIFLRIISMYQLKVLKFCLIYFYEKKKVLIGVILIKFN